MPLSMRALMKEAGAAFAVLAIYVLVLLVPLHQSAAMQRDFATLGYETLGSWSICGPISESGDDGEGQAVTACPITGIGKQTVGLVSPASLDVPSASRLVTYDPVRQASPGRHLPQDANPRGPPALA